MSVINLSDIWSGWEIEKKLGKGSYGTVYQAVRRDHHLISHAAVKIISIPQDQSEIDSLRYDGLSIDASKTYLHGIVDDFVNEIQLMESFKGMQNIVSVEDYEVIEKEGEIGWDIYIRMELLTPFNAYACDKKLSEEDVIKLGCDICSALEICGTRNIIHRDVKPENIFINDFGFFKLGDFGIARKLENMSGGLSQKGTPFYMAPEVFAGNKYDSRADIYSLGLVLYKLVNQNRLPFLDTEKQLLDANERTLALERRKSGEALPAPCEASDELAQIILKACAYNPDDRYSTATEFKNALQNLGGMHKKAAKLGKTTSVRVAAQVPKETPINDTPIEQKNEYIKPEPTKKKHSSALSAIIASLVAVLVLAAAGIFGYFFFKDRLPDNDSEKTETTQIQSTDIAETTVDTNAPIVIPEPDDAFASGDYKIDIFNGNATINTYAGNATKLEIPAEINGYPVVAIGESAFYFARNLTEITIPENITSIGEHAFGFCENLTKITVSENNPAYCDVDGVVFSKDNATIVVYPCGKKDTSYSIPSGVTTIGAAFDGCSNLTEITIPDSVTTIKDRAFYYCTGISEIRIPHSVTTIGDKAFAFCRTLDRIVIPDSVKTIGDHAFQRCEKIDDIDIPSSVTSIGEGIFAECYNLSGIYVSTNNTSYCDIGGIMFSKDKTALVAYPCGKEKASYTIPNGVKTIGESAFRSCEKLTEIVIPDSVTSIENYALHSCSQIVSVELPQGITSIGEHAFEFCESLTDIIIPDGITAINDYAFNACGSLASVTVGAGLTTIGKNAFGFCESLTEIVLSDSVTSIDADAFLFCDDLVIKCSEASYAAEFAKGQGITVENN